MSAGHPLTSSPGDPPAIALIDEAVAQRSSMQCACGTSPPVQCTRLSDLTIDAPCCQGCLRNEYFGARSWGHVRGLSGPLRVIQEMVERAEKPDELQEKRATERFSAYIAGARSLHGKYL